MKKLWYGLAVGAIVIGAVGYFGRDSFAQPIFNRGGDQAEVTIETGETLLPAVTAPDNVIVEAIVVPNREANLSVATSGIVEDVLVVEGETVIAGTPILQLANARQQAAVAQAEANLRNAELKLAELVADPRPEEVARYQASITSAQASLQKLYDDPRDADITVARSDLAKAEAALRQAQSDYDQVSWSNDISMMPQATALEQATNDYVAAQARYDGLFDAPNTSDIAGAQAQVTSAQAELDNFLAGSKDETIAAAEASVAASGALLQDAIAAMEQTVLTAPFDGTIAAINVEMGEQVAPGAAAVTLADFSSWRIETDDLTELSVVNVQPGDNVGISFDALPETALTGHVVNIKPIGENKQGDITYTVLIELDEQDEQLRWNMTAEAVIIRDDVGRAAARPAIQSPVKVQAAPVPVEDQVEIEVEAKVEAKDEVQGVEQNTDVGELLAIVDAGSANLNVRSGPGAGYSVIGKTPSGAVLTVIGESDDGSWTLVQTGNSQLGWVASDYLRVDDGGDGLNATSQFIAVEGVQPEFEGPAAPFFVNEAVAGVGSDRPLVFQTSSGGLIYAYDFATGDYWPLVSGMDPSISPDGQSVAFVRNGGEHGLYVVDVNGSNERLIFNGGEGLRAPSWSPDGEYIVFSRYTGDYDCRQIGSSICLPDSKFLEDFPLTGKEENQLSRVDINGDNFRDIPSLTTAVAPEWTEAGIVYQSSSGIQVTADTPDSQDRSVIAKFLYEDPDWQADGGRIVFQSREGNHREIFTVNPDGSDLQALTRPLDLLAAEYPQNVAPAWSPNGEQVAFLSNRGEDNSAGDWAIWLMEADGSNQQPLPIALDFEYAFGGEQMLSW